MNLVIPDDILTEARNDRSRTKAGNRHYPLQARKSKLKCNQSVVPGQVLPASMPMPRIDLLKDVVVDPERIVPLNLMLPIPTRLPLLLPTLQRNSDGSGSIS